MDEERKLLRAHYEDSISPELFAEEEQRIRRERAAAEETVQRLSGEYDLALANLDKALGLTADIQAAYDLASGHVRRLMNQSIFDKLLIRDEEVVGHVLAEPFRQLLADDLEALAKPSLIPQAPQGEPVGALASVGAVQTSTPTSRRSAPITSPSAT